MRLLISLIVLSCLSCENDFSLNSPEDLDKLKTELQTQLGHETFSSLWIGTKDMYGTVTMASINQYSADAASINFDYNFDLKKLSAKREGVKLEPAIRIKGTPAPKVDPLKFKKFKISDIDFSTLRPKFNEAANLIDKGNKYEYIVLANVQFEDRKPKDGKLDISFEIRATLPSRRGRYQRFEFDINTDGTLERK